MGQFIIKKETLLDKIKKKYADNISHRLQFYIRGVKTITYKILKLRINFDENYFNAKYN